MNLHHLLAFACAAAAVAAAFDLRSRTIPNWLTLGLLVAAPVAHGLAHRGSEDVWTYVLGSVVGAFACALVPALLAAKRVVGAGDLKLFACLGAVLGARIGIEAEFYSFAAAAFVGLALLLRRSPRAIRARRRRRRRAPGRRCRAATSRRAPHGALRHGPVDPRRRRPHRLAALEGRMSATRRRSLRSDGRGAVLAEFSIAIIPMLMAFFCFFQLGMFMVGKMIVRHAAIVGARAAAVVTGGGATNPTLGGAAQGTNGDVESAVNQALGVWGDNGMLKATTDVTDSGGPHATLTVRVEATFQCNTPLGKHWVCGGDTKTFTEVASMPKQGATYR